MGVDEGGRDVGTPRAAPGQTQEQVRTSYDVVAADYVRSMPDVSHEHPLDLAVLDTFIAATAGTPVLDAGCGAGRMSRYVADRGGRVAGVDLSPQMIAEGRARHPDLDLAVASITDLPHGDATFGGVLHWYSTIHFAAAELDAVLEESVRVLAPGGSLLLAFQSGAGTRSLFDGLRTVDGDATLVRYLRTADELAERLAGLGMQEVVRLVRSGTGPDGEGRTTLIHRS